VAQDDSHPESKAETVLIDFPDRLAPGCAATLPLDQIDQQQNDCGCYQEHKVLCCCVERHGNGPLAVPLDVPLPLFVGQSGGSDAKNSPTVGSA